MTSQSQGRPAGASPEEEQQVLDAIERWVEKEVRPIARKFDQADEYPADLVEQMKELGLFGATIGQDWGGLGLSASTYARLVARISQAWMAPTGIFNSHLIMAACVERHGTPEQKRRYLPRFATGELRGGIGLTEPDAGTDLQGIRMVARRDGDGYVLDGTKTWITNGVYGTCFAVLVKTDPEAEPRHKGTSMFIAEKGPGFTVGRKIRKLGYRAIDSAELVFANFRVGADQLVGGTEGRGFQHAVGGLELGRINVAARGVGLATGAFRDALAYAQQRHTFGKPIAQHQAIQLKLADMATMLASSRLLTADAAAGAPAGAAATMAKIHATEAAWTIALDAMRVHGGYGYTTEFPVERYYRDAARLALVPAPNEDDRAELARALLED